jgi:DNA mismatch repair ATPase MutL
LLTLDINRFPVIECAIQTFLEERIKVKGTADYILFLTLPVECVDFNVSVGKDSCFCVDTESITSFLAKALDIETSSSTAKIVKPCLPASYFSRIKSSRVLEIGSHNPIRKRMDSWDRQMVPTAKKAHKIPRLQETAITIKSGWIKDFVLVGQCDFKFIVAAYKSILIIIDQHAAHERIRLERLINQCKSASNLEPLEFHFPVVENENLKSIKVRHPNLEIKCSGNLIRVLARLPVKMDSKQCIKLIKNFDGYQHPSYVHDNLPTPIMEFLKEKACKGAIKFGDALSRAECQSLLSQLSTCKLPFQCAHGRTSIAPIFQFQKSEFPIALK